MQNYVRYKFITNVAPPPLQSDPTVLYYSYIGAVNFILCSYETCSVFIQNLLTVNVIYLILKYNNDFPTVC